MSTSNPPSQPKAHRRRRKGPPQLQFVTATDPSQFKDEKAKRSVRSHAMVQYRYQSAEQKRKTKDTLEPRTAERAQRVTPVLLNEGTYREAQKSLLSQWQDEPQQRVYSSTSEAWRSANPSEEPMEPSLVPSADMTLARPSRYYEVLATIPLNAPAQRVSDYEDTDRHDALLLRILVAKVTSSYRIGSSVDPFTVIPQFASPELNSVALVRICNRAFSSASTQLRWLPAMLSHPHILLSSTIMPSTWLDMHEGVSADSKRSALVKAESIGWINERLRDPVMQFEDSTLMVIVHLLAGEMWTCSERTIRIHQAGIARLITHRGGFANLGGEGAVAEVVVTCCYQADMMCEKPSLPLFYNWQPSPFIAGDTMSFPESPLFCPRKEFFSIIRDPECTEYTYELLCDMRDLTDLFIAHSTATETVSNKAAPAGAVRSPLSLIEYDVKIARIRARLVSLPSAYTPGLPTSNNWVYEACRIAAIIYTSAIIMRVPFSVAADPARNTILLDPAFRKTPSCTRLSEALYEVMEKTDIANLWNDMAGVYYWVSCVGAVAARSAVTINTYQRPNSQSEAYATWVRRCLMMFASRAMIIIIFQHPLPLIHAQKKFLKVQELIRKEAPEGSDWCLDQVSSTIIGKG